jgi:hypothetical protein
MISVVAYVVGFVSGWATRSIADSPQGGAVKLLEMAYDAKERLVRWTLLERERLEDILAEARARAGQDGPHREPSHNNKEKDQDNEKDEDHDQDKEKDQDRVKMKDKDKDKDKEKDKEKDKDKHQEKERGEA